MTNNKPNPTNEFDHAPYSGLRLKSIEQAQNYIDALLIDPFLHNGPCRGEPRITRLVLEAWFKPSNSYRGIYEFIVEIERTTDLGKTHQIPLWAIDAWDYKAESAAEKKAPLQLFLDPIVQWRHKW